MHYTKGRESEERVGVLKCLTAVTVTQKWDRMLRKGRSSD